MKGLNLFSELINFYPNVEKVQVLQIGDIEKEISQLIETKLSEYDGVLKNFDFSGREFNIQEIEVEPRSYKYIILYGNISEELLELAYHAFENTGDLIFIFKKGSRDIWETKDLIETRGFVAINDIDIFEEYDLISAKKKLMWARGY